MLYNGIALYNVGHTTVINVISLLLDQCYQTANNVLLMLQKTCSRSESDSFLTMSLSLDHSKIGYLAMVLTYDFAHGLS